MKAMKTHSIIILTMAALLMCVQSNAQMKGANKKYNNMAYTEAIAKYERVLAKMPSNNEAQMKLADCYRLTNDMVKAEAAYAKVVNAPGAKAEHYLYYAQALMENEKYTEASAALDKYKAMANGDKRADNMQKGISNMAMLKSTEGVYSVKKTNLNSDEGDFSPVAYNGGLVFTSNRNNLERIGYDHSWTGKQFYRLYEAKGAESSFSAATPFAEKIDSRYHDGPVCFNATGSQMYFTRNNVEDGQVRKDDKDIVRLKIFSTTWSDGNWGIEVPFAHNSDKHSCAHPALSADGKTLYFSSDMPGGQGGMDIWKCEWNGTSWGSAVNLGNEINTAGTEVFPTVSNDGTLYYASNGLAGLGGLDIYYQEKGRAPLNMGAPINSSDDDFGISLNAAGSTGYFSSNRKAQGKNDDIYYFKKQCTNTDILILDEVSGEAILNAEVKVIENGTEKSTVMTDSTGRFNMCLNPLNNYEFIARKGDYTENKSSLSATELATAAGSGTSVTVALRKNTARLTGRVFNADDKTGVANHPVVLFNKTKNTEMSTTTDANGNYAFEDLLLNMDYEVKSLKKDCGESKETFNTRNVVGAKTISFDLPMLCKGDIIKIENIYYDYNKYDIRPDAGVELDKVLNLLNKYPEMKIELRSHTDARGKDGYNLKLSDNRAKSAVDYIISKGIAKERLVAKGYGETELLNHCKNNVECDDKTHEQNRRTEFKILSM
ncbi:MAG: OmpA family protein [Flavobacteriales bacterium]